MSSKETPRREWNNVDTLARARKRIEAVTDAETLEAWREDIAIAQGWFGALQVEGLVNTAEYNALMAELDAAVAKWDDDAKI